MPLWKKKYVGFFCDSCKKFVHFWQKCIVNVGDYVDMDNKRTGFKDYFPVLFIKVYLCKLKLCK